MLGVVEIVFRDAGPAVGIDDRKLRLLVAGAQFDEQVEDFVDHFLRARVFAIDLVDDDDRAQVEFERFAQHESRLRHHAFGGVDEQHDALHHLQHALDLAAEVGVAGRIDDIEFQIRRAAPRCFLPGS